MLCCLFIGTTTKTNQVEINKVTNSGQNKKEKKNIKQKECIPCKGEKNQKNEEKVCAE
jgi:hypothetical protein